MWSQNRTGDLEKDKQAGSEKGQIGPKGAFQTDTDGI
jgi:hypothetical protein